MKLISLRLKNFKGIRGFTLETGGGDVAIFADNGVGKTTLFDAFTWLMFGKDSQNKTDFEIKTLNSEGTPEHGLEHEVEAVLNVEGAMLTLRRVYSEIWTKKRGQAKREFTGHSTDYYLDGVPVKKNEYEARVSSIVKEDAFKLITNPRYFNEVLHWQERRKILLDVCGDVSDEDVVASDNALDRLPSILNGRKIEDHRKVIMSRRTEINKELELLPVRIDEAQQGLPQTIKRADEINPFLTLLREDRNKISQRIATMEAGGEIAAKTKELREVESELLEIQKAYWVRCADKTQQKKIELRKVSDEAGNIEITIDQSQHRMEANQSTIGAITAQLEQLRKDWIRTSAQIFTFEQDENCPACGQALPEAKLSAARDQALSNFNAGKSKALQDIDDNGKRTKNNMELLVAENSDISQNIAVAQTKLAEAENRLTDAEKAVAAMEEQEKDYMRDEDYLKKQAQKEAIEKQIEMLKTKGAEAVDGVRFELQEKDEHISECETALAEIQQRETGLKRIEALKGQERELAAEYERLESELFLTEQFVRTKVKLLEEKINSKFAMARFKLFDEQVNGAISEVCIATANGVPYNSGLNNGMQIAIGMDIISALQKHYQFIAPIWIDQAESFCHLPKMNCQVISLFVSAKDPVLRIEKQINKKEEK